MLTNSQIVEFHYQLIRQKCRIFWRHSLADDLAQEVAIILMAMDNQKLNELVANYKLMAYIWVVIRKSAVVKSSAFRRLHGEKLIEGMEIDYESPELEEAITKAIDSLPTLTEYEKRVLAFMMEGYSTNQISKQTGISRNKIQLTKAKIKEKLR